MRPTKTNQNHLLLIVLFSFLSILLSCASDTSMTEQSGPRTSYAEESESLAITNAAAEEVGAHSFIEIQFQPGSAILSGISKTSLDRLINSARLDGNVDQIMVMSWADEEFPSKHIGKLPALQIRLAARRNEALKNYIKATQPVTVESFNMAEDSPAYEKISNTEDRKLKNSFVAAGLPTTADDPQYPGKASHAVILVKVK